MLAYLYYVCVSACSIGALIHWRSGLLLCVFWDALRDPIRKLAPGHPVLITLMVAGLWLAVFLGAWQAQRRRILYLPHLYPPLRKAFHLLLLALIPAAAISTLAYDRGWMLAAMGGLSYCFPIVALMIGFAFARDVREVYKLLAFYTVLNSAMLVGTLLEYFGHPFPALGGIDMQWIRYQHGYIVELMCGFYRSPDLLGVHAAHVMMFGGMLSLRTNTRTRWLWIPLVIFAGVCLILCGRRKMIFIPVLFAAVYLYMNLRRRGLGSAMRALALLAVAGVCVFLFLPSRGSDDATEYVTYASTVAEEGVDRISRNSLHGFVVTMRQAGIFGYGLGTATQGSYHVAYHGRRTWQEDGFSRLGAELGLPGAVLVLWAVGLLIWQCCLSTRMVPAHHPAATLQVGLVGVLVGNAASFFVSHQAYSGDPSTIAIASMCLGFLLAGPVMAASDAQPQYVTVG